MASDPKIGSFLAGVIGTGHKLENFVQKITRSGVPDQTWSQFYRESFMDMKNNRLGLELAREGARFTDVDDPRLYFGSGGKFGQPTGAPYNAEKIGEVEVMGS